MEQHRLGQTMISSSLPKEPHDCQRAGRVHWSAQSLLDCNARGCIHTRTNSTAQRFLHSNRSRHQRSSHLPQKQGWREAQLPGRALCSTERVETQQVGNIQTDALQQAQWQCFNQDSPILSFSQVINPEEVIIPDAPTQESLHTKLKSTKDWTEKITIQLILRDFTSFMEKTVRAVRYLKNTRSFSVWMF